MKKFILADKQLSLHALQLGGTQLANETGEPRPTSGFENIHQTNVELFLYGNYYVVNKTVNKNGLVSSRKEHHLEIADARKDFKQFSNTHKLKLVDQTNHYKQLLDVVD